MNAETVGLSGEYKNAEAPLEPSGIPAGGLAILDTLTRRPASPGLPYRAGVLIIASMLVSACAPLKEQPGITQPVETAAVPTISVPAPFEIPAPATLTQEPPATELALGGAYQTCEAAAENFLVGKPQTDQGYVIPTGVMGDYPADPEQWTDEEKKVLVDGDGNSIAPAVLESMRALRAIDPGVRFVRLWQGEGYVLALQDSKGNFVWAISKEGVPQFRPDVAKNTDRFDTVPQQPLDGELRYVVTGGCGVLGVFDGDVMRAMFSPLAWEWQLLAPPIPEPTATPAEAGPTSCLDKEAQQKTLDTNLHALGYVPGEEGLKLALGDFIDKYGLRDYFNKYGQLPTSYITTIGNTYTENVLMKKTLLMGHFQIQIPGGHVQCAVIVYPVRLSDGNMETRVVSPVVSIVIGNEMIRNVGFYDVTKNKYLFDDEGELIGWLDNHMGQAIAIRMDAAQDDQSYNNLVSNRITGYPTYNGSLLEPLARDSYLRRLASAEEMKKIAGDARVPDVSKISQSLDPIKEVGLFASGIGDPIEP